ncbi:MAG: SPASM domain-containing protein, partial [Muribaculaceae bacterium]|nr:SPASM domain-containing protein [Muribaculaceae bacterium]
VEWNAMAVINDYNADYPLEFYNFFKDLGCHYIQFTPIVERLKQGNRLASVREGGDLAPFSVTPEQWGDFLCALFDEWVKADVGTYYIQLFDATLANWAGVEPGVCTMAPQCGHAGVMEYNGDVYSCDHFVFPDYRLGNIRDTSFIEMMGSDRQLRFGASKRDSLPRQCRQCRWLFACNGECPKNRFAVTADGEPGLNYLCAGYRKFFGHVAPYMDFMKAELDAKRPPANVMNALHLIDGK